MYAAVSVATVTGIPLLLLICNEHTACMRMLKVSNIPEVTVEFERYRT